MIAFAPAGGLLLLLPCSPVAIPKLWKENKTKSGDLPDDGPYSDRKGSNTVTDLQVVGRLLLRLATDLADHDDALRLGVAEEDVEAVEEVGPVEGVAADADAQRLAEADLDNRNISLSNNDRQKIDKGWSPSTNTQ